MVEAVDDAAGRPGRRLGGAIFAPVGEVEGRTDEIVKRIIQGISLGVLKPGEQLPTENELAAQLGVATLTVRGALAQLRERNILETRRGRVGGSFITAEPAAARAMLRERLTRLSPLEIRDIGDLRVAVSTAAVVLAARRGAISDFDHLRAAAAGLGSGLGSEAFSLAEQRLHLEIVALSQSPRLTRAEVDAQSEMSDVLALRRLAEEEMSRVAKGFRELADLISERRGLAARSWMEEHMAEENAGLLEFHRLTVREG